jgi:hypothetical protein
VLKKRSEYAWLNEASSVPVWPAAIANYFAKRGAVPAFKSKHGQESAAYAFTWGNGGKEPVVAKIKGLLAVRTKKSPLSLSPGDGEAGI